MPNWCSNSLRAIGPKSEIDRFLKKAQGYGAAWPKDPAVATVECERRKMLLDFNQFVPVPEEVVAAGYRNDKGSKDIRFAGRHWKVRRVEPTVVELEPSHQGGALEIRYSGPKAPRDPANIEEMLRLLDDGIDVPHMASESGKRFLHTAKSVRNYVGWDRVPVVVDQQGYHYFTVVVSRGPVAGP